MINENKRIKEGNENKMIDFEYPNVLDVDELIEWYRLMPGIPPVGVINDL